MTTTTSGKIPRVQPATRQDIYAAVEGLSKPDRLRLKSLANWYVFGHGKLAQGLSADDLLQEAITRTLEGKRQWYKDRIDFVRHLDGVMRSIASHWGKTSATGEYTNPEVTAATNDPPSSPEHLRSSVPDPEEEAIAAESLGEIYGFFEDDEEVWQIILHRVEGRRGGEIQHEMGISSLQFQAAIKRMQRKIAKLTSTRGRHE